MKSQIESNLFRSFLHVVTLNFFLCFSLSRLSKPAYNFHSHLHFCITWNPIQSITMLWINIKNMKRKRNKKYHSDAKLLEDQKKNIQYCCSIKNPHDASINFNFSSIEYFFYSWFKFYFQFQIFFLNEMRKKNLIDLKY